MGYIWIIYVSGVHSKKRRLITPRQIQALALSSVWLVYTCMNKYGLATSIHSFVASKAAKTHYPSIVLWYASVCLLYANRALKPGAAFAMFLVGSYSSLQWCVFFKKPVIAIAITTITYRRAKVPFVRSYHSAISCLALIAIAFNLQNTPFFDTSYRSTKSCSASCHGPLWNFTANTPSPSNIV